MGALLCPPSCHHVRQLRPSTPLADRDRLASPPVRGRTLELKATAVAMLGEFVGTTLFLLAYMGTNIANLSNVNAATSGEINTSGQLYVAISFGFSLCIIAWAFFRVSGALFNPAVSLGMVLIGALPPLRAVALSVSQLLGGIVAAAIASGLSPGPVYFGTSLGGGASVVQGLFIELFMTSVLMIVVLMLAAEKSKATFLAPIGIGLALFIAEIRSVYWTGGSLNPARSFGPAVVTGDFPGHHWIYWIGPGLGAMLAAGFYKLLKYLQYEMHLGPQAEASTQAEAAMIAQAQGHHVHEKRAKGSVSTQNTAGASNLETV